MEGAAVPGWEGQVPQELVPVVARWCRSFIAVNRFMLRAFKPHPSVFPGHKASDPIRCIRPFPVRKFKLVSEVSSFYTKILSMGHAGMLYIRHPGTHCGVIPLEYS